MEHPATNRSISNDLDVSPNGEDVTFSDSSIISDAGTTYAEAQVKIANCTPSDSAVVLDVRKEEPGSVTLEQVLSMDLTDVDISSSGSTIDMPSTSCGDFHGGNQHASCVVSDVGTPFTCVEYVTEKQMPYTKSEQLADYSVCSYDRQVKPPGCVPILVELPDGQVIQVMGEAAPTDPASQQDIHVPEVVAAETVVTTALPRRRKQAFPTVVRSGLGSPRVEMVSPSSASDGSASVWSPSVLQVDGSMLSSASNCFEEASEAELSTSQESFVALIPNSLSRVMVTDAGVIMPMMTQDASIRETTKRERDRLKKRELRQNPAFKEREKIKARSRMRNRRCDPEYREVERQKDRYRRRASRQRNIRQRQVERERDKTYKRQRRTEQTICAALTETECKDVSYAFDIGDAESIGLDE
ncbi:hypothetical protein LSAT2_028784 [Lamellibrachia satsuma]|nr:hypothetical protein LSAT2_028784 [Lamellibrachia satsuma]